MTPARILAGLALCTTLAASAAVADEAPAAAAPFAFGDFTWMNGNSRQKSQPLTIGPATFGLYFDGYYDVSANHPKDDTIVGSASIGRDNEFTVNLVSAEVDVSYRNVISTLALQAGNMLSIVQQTDGSVARGRNLETSNNRYVREATAGYHWDRLHGVNLEMGIFPSYIGLESYLLAENWSYNRSLVCDFTPFYFTGARLQIYPSDRLKVEPWLMNGFQTYGKWNRASSLGTSITYRPKESLGFVANFYYGTDTRGVPDRKRFHHDDSILLRYVNRPQARGVSKMAVSLNNHYGFETGGGGLPASRAYMAGSSLANRIWFDRDRYAVTLRVEYITNPSRYLAPAPTAAGFPPGADDYHFNAGGVTATFDFLPTDFMDFRLEYLYRTADVPFFAGPGGTTSPDGFQGTPGAFTPDLKRHESRFLAAVNFRL